MDFITVVVTFLQPKFLYGSQNSQITFKCTLSFFTVLTGITKVVPSNPPIINYSNILTMWLILYIYINISDIYHIISVTSVSWRPFLYSIPLFNIRIFSSRIFRTRLWLLWTVTFFTHSFPFSSPKLLSQPIIFLFVLRHFLCFLFLSISLHIFSYPWLIYTT